jgi:hypothetical protein
VFACSRVSREGAPRQLRRPAPSCCRLSRVRDAARCLSASGPSRLPTSCKLRRLGPAHVVCPPEPLPNPYTRSGEVELPTIHAVSGKRGECVVSVVPRLTEGQESKRRKVLGSVTRSKRAASKGVTDRVDAPRDVMDEQDADYASPDQPGQGARQGARVRPSRNEGDSEAAERPHREESRYDAEVSILQEVGCESFLVGGLGSKQPPDVRVEQTAQSRTPRRVARLMVVMVSHNKRGVRVARLIRNADDDGGGSQPSSSMSLRPQTHLQLPTRSSVHDPR